MEKVSLCFIYKENEEIIQCDKGEYLKDIFQKYSNKINKELKNINFTENEQLMNENLKLEELNIENEIKIMVNDLSDLDEKRYLFNIECPECNENCYLEIKDYRLNFNNCEGEHSTKEVLLDKYIESKKLNDSKIICNECNKNKNEIEFNEFYRCYTCNINLCPSCKIKHNNNHNIFNNADNYIICKEHGEKYTYYCTKCNKNLCFMCKETHPQKHEIKVLNENLIQEDYKTNINEFKIKIEQFNKEIKNLINILNKVMNYMELLYKLYNNAFYCLENKIYNLQIVKNINTIKNYSNNVIINDINKIINERKIVNKFKYINDIYEKMININSNEVTIRYKVDEELNEIQLFGKEFVQNNNNICEIINDGVKYKLQDIYNKNDFKIKDNILEIKLSGIKYITNMSHIFDGCSSFLDIPDILNWSTLDVYEMSYIFSNCKSLTSLPDISNWDTSNVLYMENMFQGCSSLKSLPDISKWEISNVKNISQMFKDCTELISLPDISRWNASNVKEIDYLFYNCSSLSSLPDISKWNISSLSNLSYLFFECKSLSELPDI